LNEDCTIAPVDALVAVDVGNTRIGIAVWDDDGLHDVCRVASSDAGEWEDAIERAWGSTLGKTHRAIVIASVQPEAARRFADCAGEQCDVEPLFVRDDIPFPMPLKVDNPDEVGVDRVCAAAAAYERVGEACVIASFGSATTIDCVSPEGAFLGGAIMPGLDMSCAALHERTALLPSVTADKPVDSYPVETRSAIVHGVVFGAVGALREITERFATLLRVWPRLIVTGGSAPLVAEHADFIDCHVPDLALMGVALAYRKAAGQS